ncbi:MAG: molybdenum cofactor cytidylyltransferase [Salibacteraceae bacterium]
MKNSYIYSAKYQLGINELLEKVKTSKSHIAIIVLAADQKKGVHKTMPLLPWGHSTLLGHILKEVVKTQINDLYVVLGHDYSSVFERHKHFPVRFIHNTHFKYGEHTSIHEAINEIKTLPLDGVLFLRADQPELDHVHLKKIRTSFSEDRHKIIATQHGNKVGLPCLFDASYFKTLQEMASVNESLTLQIQRNLAHTLLIPTAHSFHTIDTWTKYLQKHKDWFGEINPI